jgi:hypothetical protein
MVEKLNLGVISPSGSCLHTRGTGYGVMRQFPCINQADWRRGMLTMRQYVGVNWGEIA